MSTANKIMLVNNRVERAKSFLLSQFKDRPNINALVDALVSELQELEKVLIDIQTVRTLEGSYGWWTDQIGAELDITRGNYGDNDFKTAIKIAMSKQSASATVDDILRIVSLITNDTSATIYNRNHYVMELFSWLFCVSESYDGLHSLGQLFPINTRVRMVKHDLKPIMFNVLGRGIDVDTTISDLAYHKYGITEDPRFVVTATQEIPPPIISSPTVVTSPYIYGTSSVGSVLTLVRGTYNGDEPLSYTYQWLRAGANISGATGQTYTLVNDDAGVNISCKVTVTNSSGELVVYSNTIPVDSVIPPTSPFTPTLGIYDFTATRFNNTTSAVVCEAEIEITRSGVVNYYDNGSLDAQHDWSSSPSANVGDEYSFIYTVVTGTELSGLNQNVARPLTSDLSLSMSLTSRYDAVKTGTYDFTIFKTSDNSIISTKRIYLSVEIVA